MLLDKASYLWRSGTVAVYDPKGSGDQNILRRRTLTLLARVIIVQLVP